MTVTAQQGALESGEFQALAAERIDWRSFLTQHDLIWDVSPQEWLHGIPLANGHIGAMIWGDGGPLKVTLDKYDCWELREQQPDPEFFNYATLRRLVERGDHETITAKFRRDNDRPELPYPTRLPLPRLEIDFGQAAIQFKARLSLFNGQAAGSLQFEAAQVNWVAFVHAQQNLLVINVEGSMLPKVWATMTHLTEAADEGQTPAWETLAQWGYTAPEMGQEEGINWLRMGFPGGGEYVVAHLAQPTSAGTTIFVSIFTHNDAVEPLEEAIRTVHYASTSGPAKLAETHRSWWADYWPASYLTIPDAHLENLYYAEMYKLGCNSRPDGLPITLQGLWTCDGTMPPWSGDYHLDMNVEESYWPIYTANRLEAGECLYETFFNCLPTFEHRCKEFFGFEGAWSGCAIGPGGQRIYGYPATEFWPGNGAWLAHHFWLHWLYSRDEDFLRERAYPFMAAFMRTYTNLLEEGPDGKLHIPLSNSPEYGEGSFEAWVSDPTCDLALIRWLAQVLLEVNDILGLGDPEAEQWQRVLDRLVDYPQSEAEGLLVAANTPLAHSHRHHAHLMGVYPLGVLSIHNERSRVLIGTTLQHLRRMGTGEWTGWAFPWASLIAARADLPNMAWQMLDLYGRAFIAPNTLHINGDPRIFGISLFDYSPMTLEAGFAAAAAVMELLLQSYGGVIRVFPAVPDHWHDACFADLRAEGAFLVGSLLREGEVAFIQVTSLAGVYCRIANPWGVAVQLCGGDADEGHELEGEIIEFDTTLGGQYLLHPVGHPPSHEDLQPQVPLRPEAECNWFGLQRLSRF